MIQNDTTKQRNQQIWFALPLLVACLFATQALHAQGNYAYAPTEFTAFSEVSLTTATSWTTDRDVTLGQGFFGAVGVAPYTGADDTYHVNGYMKHTPNAADQAYDFPVGTGTDLRTLSISGTRPMNAVIGTAWIEGDPTATTDPTNVGAGGGMHPIANFDDATLIEVLDVGQWDWIDYNQAADGATVTVSIPDVSGITADGNAVEDLRLAGWDGTQWVGLENSLTTATGLTEDSTLSGTVTNGISALAIGIFRELPDLIALINSTATAVQDGEEIEVTISYVNVGAGATVAPSRFLIQVPSTSFTPTIQPNITSLATLGNVDNTDVTFTQLSSQLYLLTTKSGILINPFESVTIGFTLEANSILPSTGLIFTRIEGGTGGGETPTTNNTASVLIGINE